MASNIYVEVNMDNIRTLTMYLPQFHRTPENDKWWGEGFTEWTAVRAAKPLFDGHLQPRIPLNKYYYDLLDKEVMQKQVQWMREYGIDGQCFYHYYFKDGRRVLEKPAENLLCWTDVDMPFCFCWANTTWVRTWSNIGGNTWADEFEQNDSEENKSGILLNQKYGREEAWRKHFEYLLPFFRDKRYIKVDGRPVFLITWIAEIPCLQPMVAYWKELAAETGIPEVYFIGMGVNYAVPNMDALLIGGPHSFWKLGEPEEGLYKIRYDDVWEQTLATRSIKGCKTYIGGFVDYDDTARRGRHGGIVMDGFSVQKFYRGMKELYKRNLRLCNDLIFINAWNEWGEGMYLEPDEEYRFELLDAVRRAKRDAINELRREDKEGCEQQEIMEVSNQRKGAAQARRCFDFWMTLRENGRSVAEYLIQYNIRNVAVYGYGALGKHLITELSNSAVSISYIIDRDVRLNHLKYEIKSPNEYLPPVDAIIVTPVDDFESIYFVLRNSVSYRIISLLELTSELI